MNSTNINTPPLFKIHEGDLSHHIDIGTTRTGMSAPLLKIADEYARLGGRIMIIDKGPSK